MVYQCYLLRKADVAMKDLYGKDGALGALFGKGKYISDATVSAPSEEQANTADNPWCYHRNSRSVQRSGPGDQDYVDVLDVFRDFNIHMRDTPMRDLQLLRRVLWNTMSPEFRLEHGADADRASDADPEVGAACASESLLQEEDWNWCDDPNDVRYATCSEMFIALCDANPQVDCFSCLGLSCWCSGPRMAKVAKGRKGSSGKSSTRGGGKCKVCAEYSFNSLLCRGARQLPWALLQEMRLHR